MQWCAFMTKCEVDLFFCKKKQGKSPFDVPHLLPKSIFRSSCAKPDIWGPPTIKSGYFWSLSCFGGWFSHDVVATGYIRSLNYQICLFLSLTYQIYLFFWKVIFAWRGAGSTYHVHVEVGPMSRGYLLPLSHSSFPLANTSFSPSPHPYPERRSSRVVDSNDGKLMRWRKTRETTTSSCDGDMQSDTTRRACVAELERLVW
jgi:hypothetical protein